MGRRSGRKSPLFVLPCTANAEAMWERHARDHRDKGGKQRGLVHHPFVLTFFTLTKHERKRSSHDRVFVRCVGFPLEPLYSGDSGDGGDGIRIQCLV